MILLGLAGAKQSGKDTAFAEIQKWASERGVVAARNAFADKLKLSAYRLFKPDCSLEEAVEWADAVKFRGKITSKPAYGRFTRDTPESDWLPENIPTHEISGRELLQRYGTEAHREVSSDNFWVDAVLPVGEVVSGIPQWMDSFPPEAEIAIMTDVRFPNEAARIHELGGQVWRVERPDWGTSDQHASEIPLDDKYVDRVLVNNSTLEDFQRLVDTHINDLTGHML